MRWQRRRIVLGLAAALCLLTVTPAEGQAEPELAVIANVANKAGTVDSDFLGSVFTTTQTYWPGGSRIVAFNLSPGSTPRVAFDRAVLGMSPDDVSRYWIDRKVRGGAPPPRQVPDPTIVVRLVAKLESAIAYVPVQLLDPSVRVVARIRHGKVSRP